MNNQDIAAAPHNVKPQSADLAKICEMRRQACAPEACDRGKVCWVRQGSEAYKIVTGANGRCLGCQGKIKGGFEFGTKRQVPALGGRLPR